MTTPPASAPADRARAALAARVLDALPQTQCARCGYPDCASYAQAIANDQAPINQCPPGGAEGVRRLAAITGQPVIALDPARGAEGPRQVAWIDEDWCIGCTLCIAACPVDCIVGTHKRMHTVIEDECTGCELCVAACPVDCIHMENVTAERTGWDAWSDEQAALARQRHEATRARRGAAQAACTSGQPASTTRPTRRTEPTATARGHDPRNDKSAVIAAALARAKSQRQGRIDDQ